MSTLYLLQYNNYYNRIVKKYDTLNDYLTNIPESRRYTLTNINFFYNDNVNTVQTINYKVPEQIPEGYFDYLLVDNDNYGLSRWFIIECKWNRQGQQILTLRRDLLVDFMSSYLTQPLFAEKGTILSGTSALMPLISNHEDVSASQILQSKTDLDESNRAVVGYIDRTYDGDTIVLDANAIYANNWDELGLTDYIGQTLYTPYGSMRVYVNVNKNSAFDENAHDGWTFYADFYGGTGGQGVGNFTSTAWTNQNECDYGTAYANASDVATALKTAFTGVNISVYQNLSKEWFNEGGYDFVNQYSGIPLMVGGQLYKLVITSSRKRINVNLNNADWSAFSNNFKQQQYCAVNAVRTSLNRTDIHVDIYANVYQIAVEKDTTTSTIDLSSITTRAHCGQPYDIFYMADSTTARQIASIIAARLHSSGALYDLQLLPYPPSTTGATSQSVTYGGQSVTLYWIKDVNATYSCTDYTKSYSTVTDYKVGCLCDTVRICSPNHANSWDFNPAQNGGVTGFNIRCTFKPLTPYIHIKPIFKWMYGAVYTTDPRGLICGGSFSFPFVTDKWANYQINNSAYFNAYERDIENLSTTQKYERIRDITNIATGTLQGAATGAGLGTYLSGGNTGAMVAGGVVGGVASLGGGIADYIINDKLRNEAMDYRQDMFGFNSRNMIMSPRSLARTDSFDIDWNGPAYVEFYSASDGEKEAIRNKLKYNGWSLNVVVSPSNTQWFTNGIKTLLNNAKTGQSNYVKGRLIYTTQYDDTHIFNELANEWYKGFYWDTSNGELT